MKLKILLLGSNGQLGSYLSKNLKTNSKYKIIKSKKYNINLISIKKKVKILDKINPDVIINCSAYTNVEEAEKDNENYYEWDETNTRWVEMTQNILE